VPLRARWLPILLAVAAAGLALGLGFVAIAAYVQPVLPWTVIGISVAIAVVVIGVCSRKPLTALGAETRDHLRGLEEFIRWAEADRIRMLQSPAGAERVAVDVNDPRQKLDLYEKLLPYAVVFGQEKQWSAELAVLYTAVGATGPYWYYGSGAFDASSFSAGIGSLSSAAMSSSSTRVGRAEAVLPAVAVAEAEAAGLSRRLVEPASGCVVVADVGLEDAAECRHVDGGALAVDPLVQEEGQAQLVEVGDGLLEAGNDVDVLAPEQGGDEERLARWMLRRSSIVERPVIRYSACRIALGRSGVPSMVRRWRRRAW
jgi:hypothetical protein